MLYLFTVIELEADVLSEMVRLMLYFFEIWHGAGILAA